MVRYNHEREPLSAAQYRRRARIRQFLIRAACNLFVLALFAMIGAIAGYGF